MARLPLIALLACSAPAFAAELPPLPRDRLAWYECRTDRAVDPKGYQVRISRDYLSLVRAYAELWQRGDGPDAPAVLVGAWDVTPVDHSTADVLSYEFRGAGFHFRSDLPLDLDQPRPLYEARAVVERGGRVQVLDLTCL